MVRVCSSRLAALAISGEVDGFLGAPFGGFETVWDGVGAAGLRLDALEIVPADMGTGFCELRFDAGVVIADVGLPPSRICDCCRCARGGPWEG